MSVIRISKSKNYTVMSNIHLRDKNISLKAKGLLSVALSLPDDWNYSLSGLASICKESITAIRSAIKELCQNGYATVEKLYPEKDCGRSQIEYVYTFYEEPQNTERQNKENQDIENLHVEGEQVEDVIQINTNKLNIDKENTKEINTDKSNTNNKASTKVEVNYKALSWTSGNKVVGKLPYEYTQEQFDEFIKGRVSDIVKKNFPDNKEEIEPISKIISYFYEQYLDNMGERHPVMSDAVYLGIVKKLLNPIDAIWGSRDRLNVLGYEAMIDRFFKTDYGEKSGHYTDYRIGYFFSDTVMENLFYRELY
mgnify:CR=1 FL=1